MIICLWFNFDRNFWPKKVNFYKFVEVLLSNVQTSMPAINKGVPRWCSGKGSACHCRGRKTYGLILGLEKSPEGGSRNPLQYSCLESFTDRGAWQATSWGRKELDTTEWLSIHAWSHEQGKQVPLKITDILSLLQCLQTLCEKEMTRNIYPNPLDKENEVHKKLV